MLEIILIYVLKLALCCIPVIVGMWGFWAAMLYTTDDVKPPLVMLRDVCLCFGVFGGAMALFAFGIFCFTTVTVETKWSDLLPANAKAEMERQQEMAQRGPE